MRHGWSLILKAARRLPKLTGWISTCASSMGGCRRAVGRMLCLARTTGKHGRRWGDRQALNGRTCARRGRVFRSRLRFTAPVHYRDYRVQVSAEGIRKWGVSELVLFDKGQEVRVAGPEHFASAWMSAGSGSEWVYVDLGAVCAFDRVVLSWIHRAAEGAVQVSDDAAEWKTLACFQTRTTSTWRNRRTGAMCVC